MRVLKPLNNNAAVVTDERGCELVVTGRGIAYGKDIGDAIDEEGVEKIFHLSSDELSKKFQEVLASLPLEEIRAVEDIVREVRLGLGRPVSDALYVSLADHIHFALSNLEAGVSVRNALLLDIVRFYPDEYALGQRALDIVEERLGRRLPDDEAGFVALHIVNAEMGDADTAQRAAQVTRVIEEALDIVRQSFGMDVAEDSLAQYRFINHLRYFAQRVTAGAPFPEDDDTRDLLGAVATKYPDAHRCAQRIAELAESGYGVDVGCDELLYLTIHIQHAIQTNGR